MIKAVVTDFLTLLLKSNLQVVVTHFLTLLLKSNLQVDCYYSSLNIKFDYIYKNMSDIHICMYGLSFLYFLWHSVQKSRPSLLIFRYFQMIQ